MSGRALFHAMMNDMGYVDVTDGETTGIRKKLESEGIHTCGNPDCCQAAELQCARCKSNGIAVWYCSKECQLKEYKAHKKACKAGNTAPKSANQPQASRATSWLDVVGGFQTDPRSWCKGLSEKATYKRFIDSYRLRIEDDYTLRGDASGLYGGEDPLPSFLRYLQKAKKKGLMPSWWSDQKEAALKKTALTDDWANIKYAVEKADITDHYGYASGEHFILRGLAEKVEDGNNDEDDYSDDFYEDDDDDELADYVLNRYNELSLAAGFGP